VPQSLRGGGYLPTGQPPLARDPRGVHDLSAVGKLVDRPLDRAARQRVQVLLVVAELPGPERHADLDLDLGEVIFAVRIYLSDLVGDTGIEPVTSSV
jgi:hypothetical protein